MTQEEFEIDYLVHEWERIREREYGHMVVVLPNCAYRDRISSAFRDKVYASVNSMKIRNKEKYEDYQDHICEFLVNSRTIGCGRGGLDVVIFYNLCWCDHDDMYPIYASWVPTIASGGHIVVVERNYSDIPIWLRPIVETISYSDKRVECDWDNYIATRYLEEKHTYPNQTYITYRQAKIKYKIKLEEIKN